MAITYQKATDEYREGIALTIQNAFFTQFFCMKLVHKQVYKCLVDLLNPECFVIAIDDETNTVMGTVGISDCDRNAIDAKYEIIRRHCNPLLARVVYAAMKDEFLRPDNLPIGEGHVAYVAIDEAYRGHGYSKAMLKTAFAIFDYDDYSLDVLEGNEVVLPLYEGLGFDLVDTIKENMAILKTYSFRYIMEMHAANHMPIQEYKRAA